jgi:RNA polymerase sigma factor (sigma-70 family)
MSERGPVEGNDDLRCRRDAELLCRFIAVRDQPAFEELVRRHGPLVLRVCGQVLSSQQDQEDAFQATFLTLAARARKIRSAASLASWLHGVALRVARNLRRQNAVWRKKMDDQKQQFDERQQAAVDSASDVNQLHIILTEELDRLPAKYKDAVLLCDGEGHSREHAALQLGIPLGTLATNLRRGRELLRSRLAKGGIALSTAAVSGTLAELAKATAPLSADLIQHTARTSLLFHVGQAAGKAVEASTAAYLAQTMIRRMTMNTVIKTSLLCVAVAAFAVLLPNWSRNNWLRAQPQYVFVSATELPAPINLPGRWNSSANISTDGLELFFTSDRSPGWGTYVARRTNTAAAVETPTQLVKDLNHGRISLDGLSLFTNDDVRPGFGGSDIYVLNRTAPGGAFGPAVNVGPGVNGPEYERWTSLSADGLELYFTRTQGSETGDAAIWLATRASTSEPFGNAMRLPATINAGYTSAPNISADGLTLFFSSNRSGGLGNWDIWSASRPTRNAPWGAAFNLGPVVNGPLYEWQPSLSSDGKKFYFSRSPDVATTSQIWEVTVRVIPEPASHVIAAIGLASLGGFVLLRRRAL